MTLNLEMMRLGHVHRFNVAQARQGWDVREEQDATVLFEAHRRDWSRVELDMERFNSRARWLRQGGWTERTQGAG